MRRGPEVSGWAGSLFPEPIDQVKAPSDRCICHQDCPQYETCETEALDKSSKVYYLLRCVKGKFPACANCMCMACDRSHECQDGPEMGLRGGARYRMCNRPISITGCPHYSGPIPWKSEAACKKCDHVCDLRKELVWAPRVRCEIASFTNEPTKKPTEEPSAVQLDGKPTVEHPMLIHYGHETWRQYELEGRLVEEFVSTDRPVSKESEFAADMVAVDVARKAAGDLPLARSFMEKGARGIRVYEDPALQEGGTLCCHLVVSKQNGGLCTGCSDQRGTPCSYSRPAEHTSPEPAVAPAKPAKAKKPKLEPAPAPFTKNDQEIQFLRSDIVAIDRLLSELPADHVIERLGFESRKQEHEERLAILAPAVNLVEDPAIQEAEQKTSLAVDLKPWKPEGVAKKWNELHCGKHHACRHDCAGLRSGALCPFIISLSFLKSIVREGSLPADVLDDRMKDDAEAKAAKKLAKVTKPEPAPAVKPAKEQKPAKAKKQPIVPKRGDNYCVLRGGDCAVHNGCQNGDVPCTLKDVPHLEEIHLPCEIHALLDLAVKPTKEPIALLLNGKWYSEGKVLWDCSDCLCLDCANEGKSCHDCKGFEHCKKIGGTGGKIGACPDFRTEEGKEQHCLENGCLCFKCQLIGTDCEDCPGPIRCDGPRMKCKDYVGAEVGEVAT